ncbi:MAG TPA: hypothetical protein PLS03_08525, partial [Terrimicrobiaceae bacterium]|nr:hypothetical protein [Terrimicrobiaceae bacterium]
MALIFPVACGAALRAGDIWEQVDVVPMPKEISLSGKVRALDPQRFALVLGAKPLDSSRTGADWINRRLVKMGGAPLPIVSVADELAAAVTPIYLGTKDDNARIAEAVSAGVLNVGEANPGVRGYEIRFAVDGPIYLGGADAIGALYASVTFGELLQRDVQGFPGIPEADVRDWPDIQYLFVLEMEPPSDAKKSPDSPEARKAYLEKLSVMYDGMLRRKLSMVWYKPLMWGDTAFRDMSPYARETVRLGIEAGKALGISALYYHLSPFVGLRSDHPDADPDLLEQKPKARYDHWLQSWSMDEERKAYAAELARWIKETGFTDVGFHDTDTGGYLNPANWNNRGPYDQKRWGDDYTAATINKFRIFYDAVMKENPDIRLNFTLYPYTSEIFDPSEKVKSDLQRTLNITPAQLEAYRKRYSDFWTRFNEAFPKRNVSFAIREPWSADGEAGLKAFLAMIEGRPLFAWYGLAAAEFFSNVPSWLGTLHSGSVDDIVFTQNIYVDRGFVPLLSLAMREYSWNTRAPGAAKFQSRDRAKMRESAAGDNTTKSYTVILPHVVRNYFGREIAPEITRAVSLNVSPFIVLGGRPDRNIIDETEGRMKIEADRAAEAAAAMDDVWKKLEGTRNVLGLDADVFARVAYLRQVFHATHLTASVKEAVYRSQRLSAMNRIDEAAEAVQSASSQLASGVAELEALEREGPPQIASVAGSAWTVREKTVPVLRDLLSQREHSIAAAKRTGGIPVNVLDALASETELPVVSVAEAPEVDGLVNDAVWQKAHPVEAWFQSGPDRLMAEAATRFQVMADRENLYVAFRCQAAPGAGVGLQDADREFVRIYFKRPGSADSSMLAFAVWANGKVEATDRGVAVACRVSVEKEGWEGELRIPLSALGPSGARPGCRIGLLRSYSRAGLSSISATVPLDASIGGSFEEARSQLDRFPVVSWDSPEFRASARVRIVEPRVREVTLDDRIATIVDFKLIADSDSVLTDVTIDVEAVDADGKVESKARLLAEPSMRYNLNPSAPFRATFLQAVD